MTKGKGILFLFVLVAMTLANPAHAYVHVGKTAGTVHGVYHKGYNHTQETDPLSEHGIYLDYVPVSHPIPSLR